MKNIERFPFLLMSWLKLMVGSASCGAGIYGSYIAFRTFKPTIIPGFQSENDSKYQTCFNRISKLEYSKDKEINKMLHACATMNKPITFFISTKKKQNVPG